MAQFRIRLELKRGERGISLVTLGDIATETQKFLRMLGEDVAIQTLQAGWIATDFSNGSVAFNVESTGEVDEGQVRTYRHSLSNILVYRPEQNRNIVGVRNETLVQYARIATITDEGESLRLGMFDNGNELPSVWHDLSRQQAAGIIEYFDEWIAYSGMIQGIIHSLYKESQPSYFDVRDLSSEQLVKCVFSPQYYDKVVRLLQRKDAIVLIAGEITARRTDRKIRQIEVRRMEVAPDLTDEEFEKFFGCAPEMTGTMSTEDFIDQIRADDK